MSGLPSELCWISSGRIARLQDIDGESAIFTVSGQWYTVHLDEFVEATQGRDIYRTGQQRAVSNGGRREGRGIVSDRILPDVTIWCAEGRRLLDAFGAAVWEVLELHEQQFLAAMDGDLDCNRFDLLIHMANEKKQEAKYAYLNHVEQHGCSAKNASDKC
jgi:hypothetical protein